MHSCRAHHLLALSALAAAVLAGCPARTRPEAGPARDDYRGLLAARLSQIEASGVFRVRANPVGCGCPPLEVEVGGVWMRVAVTEGEPGVLEALSAALEATPRAVFLIEGELGRELVGCGRAALYVELEASGWQGPERGAAAGLVAPEAGGPSASGVPALADACRPGASLR